jgi:hypothetical protein
MTKEKIIEQAIAAANTLLSALQEEEDLDLVSLERWNEALVRYVLYEQTNVKKELLALVDQLFGLTNRKSSAIAVVVRYIAEVQHVTESMQHLDHKIDWEPICDD